MKTINLTNFTIKKLEDKNFNPYYLIVNNENSEEAFFCFENSVKNGWDNLIKNYQNIQEIELEFEEIETNFKTYKKVISLHIFQEGEIFV